MVSAHLVAGFSWSQWLMSPGFGGLAAVVAAALAFFGVSRTLRAQREANRKQQWWDRARWALDLTLADDETTRGVGFGVLEALRDSEYADEHESEVIAAAVRSELRNFDVEDGDRRGADVPDADWGRQ